MSSYELAVQKTPRHRLTAHHDRASGRSRTQTHIFSLSKSSPHDICRPIGVAFHNNTSAAFRGVRAPILCSPLQGLLRKFHRHAHTCLAVPADKPLLQCRNMRLELPNKLAHSGRSPQSQARGVAPARTAPAATPLRRPCATEQPIQYMYHDLTSPYLSRHRHRHASFIHVLPFRWRRFLGDDPLP